MNKKLFFLILLSLLLASFVFFFSEEKKYYPQELYHVYLEGESLGYIKSKKELEDYIDNLEQDIKTKYNVKNVYIPNSLDIKKETTYNEDISSVNSIYQQIKAKSPFTITGYVVTIKGIEKQDEDKEKYYTSDVSINVLNKKIFEQAFKNTIFSFVDEDDYNKFINNTQTEVKDKGTYIEDIYIKNNVTIKKARISVDDTIYTDVNDLSKFLLFGPSTKSKTYTVKDGDTIEQIAFNNKISTNEFLIANEEFNSSDDLLFSGQSVILREVRPQFDVVEDDYTVSVESTKYKTVIKYDDSYTSGYEKVESKGKNGKTRVTKKIQYINGEIEKASVVKTQVIQEAQNRVIVRGTGSVFSGAKGDWAWPTASSYVISSGYGYRWGTLHDGIDITGCGAGSPIYAANDGVVETVAYHYINGNYIVINHKNGYYTIYAHLSGFTVKEGQVVTIGQQIGKMGSTGNSTGPHLHFGVFNGYPYRGGASSINPMALYS